MESEKSAISTNYLLRKLLDSAVKDVLRTGTYAEALPADNGGWNVQTHRTAGRTGARFHVTPTAHGGFPATWASAELIHHGWTVADYAISAHSSQLGWMDDEGILRAPIVVDPNYATPTSTSLSEQDPDLI